MTDWNREYSPSASIADAQDYFAAYRAESAAARAAFPLRSHRYGPSDAEVLDLIVVSPGAPLFVFFHGGYWTAFSKDDFTFVIAGFVPQGISVALVDYGLAPAVPLATIVEQARRAVAYLCDLPSVDASRVVVSGHSAGGHLAAMCAVTIRLRGLATISGLHDLDPLRNTGINEWLHLDASAARDLSPILHAPAAPLGVYATAGERESDSFRAQGRRFAEAWAGRGARTAYADAIGEHHFSIVQRLAEPNSALTQAIVALFPEN